MKALLTILLATPLLCLGILYGWAEETTEKAAVGQQSATSRDSAEIRQGPKVLKAGDYGVGRYIPALTFSDLAGHRHKLSDFANHPALVIAMTGTGCPLCQKYAPTLAKLEKEYRKKGIAFVFVNPNQSESIEKLKQAVEIHGLLSPYVRDDKQEIVRALGARSTTEVFVLDAARTLVYRGAVDDQYGFAYALEEPRQRYLADALDCLLAGRQPLIAATSAPGCEIFLDNPVPQQSLPDITYHNRISRILQNNCLQCHHDGGLAPFSLETFEVVKDYAGMIRSVVQQGIMPPWFAAPHEDAAREQFSIHWANDRSLSKADKAGLLSWVEAGTPLGNPTDAPVPRTFSEGWMIGQPDLILELPEPIEVKATGRMPYEHVRIATSFAEDRWVQAVELQPSSPAVVHHVLVYVQEAAQRRGEIDEETGFFAAYVPGNSYQQYPEGFAKKLPAGATLVFQLHYTPNGTAAHDQTRLGVIFSEKPPQHIIRSIGIANRDIAIPPGADNHAEKAVLKVPKDVRALAFMPHMHLRGNAIRYDLLLPDGQRERLLDVPRYDFNWQLEYRLAEPLHLPQGSRIEVTGWFDNSRGNPANPDPTKTVRWGPQTEDEMLLGYVEYYVPGQAAEEGPKSVGPTDRNGSFLEEAFRRADRNGDGKVTKEEFPRRQLVERLDENHDGAVTLDEVISRRETLRQGRP